MSDNTAILALRKTILETGQTPMLQEGHLGMDFGMRIECEVGQRLEQGENHIVMLSITAFHEKLFPAGIIDGAVAVSPTPEGAIQNAARIWTDCTFPVICEALGVHTDKSKVKQIAASTVDLATNRPMDWTIFRSDLGVVGIDLSQASTSAKEMLNGEILQTLASEFPGALIPKRANWLKCSVTRQPNGDITGDCWLNNQKWEVGMRRLKEYAESLPPSRDLQVRRQFFFLQPTVKSSLPPPAPTASPEAGKKWWEVWK